MIANQNVNIDAGVVVIMFKYCIPFWFISNGYLTVNEFDQMWKPARNYLLTVW